MTYFIPAVLLTVVLTTTAFGQSIYPYYVPTRERITRINIERLPLGDYGYPETAPIRRLYDEYMKHKISDFFAQPDDWKTCRSTMRPGITCIELSNTRIGYIHRDQNTRIYSGYFQGLDAWSTDLQVYHDVGRKVFYIRPSKGAEMAFGPFKGEPAAELKNAEIAVKERNTFPGVTFTYLSRRWEFPDERDAMMDRNSPEYNFAGGRMGSREIEAARLLSRFFRFRLENKSGKNLFLLYRNNEPEVFSLSLHPTWRGWSRQSKSPFSVNSVFGLDWMSIPNNSAIEFETKGSCLNPEFTCAVGVYLNDEYSLFDEVEVIATFRGEKKREFSKRNAPPRRY